MTENIMKKTISINIDSRVLEGELAIPQNAQGLVIFVHGSGSSRFSPRNNYVARILQQYNLATFLVDLLTKEEDLNYEYRFDIDLLCERLNQITDYLKENKEVKELNFGYFGASTGAAAAIKSAVQKSKDIKGIVSRGGRVDLAEKELPELKTPILLIVGENDDFVVEINKEAMKKIKFPKKISIIPNATHLFEESGALDAVAHEAAEWLLTCLKEKI